jgi:hypothetical protein
MSERRGYLTLSVPQNEDYAPEFEPSMSMEIPDIPTDNLYKFLTLFGLILITGGIGVPLYQEHRYADQTVEFVSRLLVTVDNSLTALVSDKKGATDAVELLRQIITGMLNLSTYDRQVRLYWFIGLAAAGLGLICSGLGFYYWYNLHQKFHDQILRQKAEGRSQPH